MVVRYTWYGKVDQAILGARITNEFYVFHRLAVPTSTWKTSKATRMKWATQPVESAPTRPRRPTNVSDSVAGAALGIATARFVLNRQGAQDRATLQFQPVKSGWLISYSIRTH